MDLIIKDGQPTDLLKLYPEESHWVDLWLSDRSEFEFQTSGSTGPPKSIHFSRSQIIKSAERTARIFDWQPGMNAIHSLPMSFVAGRMNILRALICHQSLWRIDPKINFTLEDFSLDIKISWWTLTPAMLDKVLRMPSLNLQDATLLVGGGRLSEKIMDMAKGQKFSIWESYGAAETLTHIALRKINGEDAQEGFVPIQSVELELKEKGVLITDNLLDQKVQTFDHLQRLNNGQFLIMGRTDDLINSGGLKIYPSQVESIIEGHVNFESFIKGTPDDLWGEIVTWVVQDDVDIPEDWPTWFDETPLMRPRKIQRVKELPRNKNGKWIRK